MSKDFSKTYTKRALTIHQQIELLEKRGLIINDREEVSHYLQHIGYYHLSTYFKIFQDDNIFIQNTSFEDVLKVYRFDKRLRLVFQNTLEMIEKSFRANLSNHLSIKYDNPFYLTEGPQKENFTPLLQSAIKKSKEPFLDYYKNTYSNSYPPIWMLIQIISWGELLHMYNFLERDDKQSIAKKYGY
ncbi:MAG: Abi family protein [Patescibacteria group bacterium]|nr:Abi family protein [Patescibacteria group bacterium]